MRACVVKEALAEGSSRKVLARSGPTVQAVSGRRRKSIWPERSWKRGAESERPLPYTANRGSHRTCPSIESNNAGVEYQNRI